jgi:hypothetical protein
LPDARGEKKRVRHAKQSIVGLYCDVGQSNAEYPHVEHAGHTRANTNAVADDERSSNEHDDRRKDVAETLLGGDAKDDASNARSNEEVIK